MLETVILVSWLALFIYGNIGYHREFWLETDDPGLYAMGLFMNAMLPGLTPAAMVNGAASYGRAMTWPLQMVRERQIGKSNMPRAQLAYNIGMQMQETGNPNIYVNSRGERVEVNEHWSDGIRVGDYRNRITFKKGEPEHAFLHRSRRKAKNMHNRQLSLETQVEADRGAQKLL